MRQYIGLEQINHEDDDLRGASLTIGNFDGVHLGHQRILEETVRAARRTSGPAVAITFDPSPAAVLRPEQAGGRLTPLAERLRLIAKCGIDVAVVVRPDPTFLAMAPEVFVERVIHETFRAASVVEGPDWRFGKARAGDIGLLARLGARYEYKVVLVRPLFTKIQDGDPVPVSSTLIRWLLAAGRIDDVNRLLGRPYTLFGPVGHGANIGTKIGFPTLNIQTDDMVLPADGIYACRCKVKGDMAEPPRPTSARRPPSAAPAAPSRPTCWTRKSATSTASPSPSNAAPASATSASSPTSTTSSSRCRPTWPRSRN